MAGENVEFSTTTFLPSKFWSGAVAQMFVPPTIVVFSTSMCRVGPPIENARSGDSVPELSTLQFTIAQSRSGTLSPQKNPLGVRSATSRSARTG
jgi:hypothetical protein